MDIQRIIAFIVFSFSLLLLWESWQNYSNPKPVAVEAPAAQQAAVQAAAQGADPASLPKPGQSLSPGAPSVEAAPTERGARARVITDVLVAEIDANGGDLRELLLTNYLHQENSDAPMRLFEEKSGRNYFAQSGFVGGGLSTHKTPFSLTPGEYRLKEGENALSVELRASLEGAEVVRTYTFRRGSYLVEIDTRVRNQRGEAIEAFPYYQFQRHGKAPEGESWMVYTFTGPAVYTEAGKFQKITFEDIAKGKMDYVREARDGWLAMVQHHFVAAWLAPEVAGGQAREFYTRALGNEDYTAGVILPAVQVAPGGEASTSMRLYAGPQELSKIKALAPGLDLVVDYGWLTVLAYPLFILLNWLHGLVHNWGVAIILLTVIIKLVFFPLSAASYKSMAKMRKLAPRLQHLKERYGDDRQKLHEAMMKIYKEEKINPLGGCLPILVQIPVFIALYWVLLGAVELRQAPFALWITDLSVPDPYYILPIVMAITSFIQVKLSPVSPDPVQQKIMMAMPIMFSIMFIFFPAGLVLYWLINNVLSILQQWHINRLIEGGTAAANDSKH
ncbi:MAG: preprotein translocase subunit YidC [bacterium]|nr:MAG: preprotein translocase subunit YidC [bacterium]KAF0149276.1 MAG: preprotein translocase subunit YidC [bacterium]KAF0169798.1 MAG: preprotein translocase subunit YidC [bacterium]TXT22722.1 MAG: preprotein translocase subunit YidC [bacterium]